MIWYAVFSCVQLQHVWACVAFPQNSCGLERTITRHQFLLPDARCLVCGRDSSGDALKPIMTWVSLHFDFFQERKLMSDALKKNENLWLGKPQRFEMTVGVMVRATNPLWIRPVVCCFCWGDILFFDFFFEGFISEGWNPNQSGSISSCRLPIGCHCSRQIISF